MKILVTGGNGMTGCYVKEIFKYDDIVMPARHELNVGNDQQVRRYAKQKFDYIFHFAAETDHEYCDMNPAQCYYINTIGTGNMMRLSRDLDIPIVYLSAASIFDGKKGEPYEPHDTPNPINHYNTSKWYGELIVKQWEKHYIVRAGWMFGGGPKKDKKFVNKIMNKYYAGEKKIKVCDDCIGSPTYSKSLIGFIKRIIETRLPYGIYHASNGEVSRYEFAQKIFSILGITDSKIVSCSIEDLKEEFPCKRTNYEVIDRSHTFLNLEESLKEYLNEHYRY